MAEFNRRELMAGGLAAALLASKDAEAAPAAVGAFTVLAEESRDGAPWLIAGVSPITVKVASADTGGRYVLLEIETPKGKGPGLHLHLAQNELFFLRRGSIGLQCGTERHILHAGDTFMVPKNTPHAYITLSEEPARMLNLFDPAGEMEAFFKEYAQAIPAHGPPDMASLKDLSAKHGGRDLGPPLKISDFAGL